EVVRYPGSNGHRLHRHVVRALPGGVNGFPVDAKKVKRSARVDLGELRKKLSEYLAKYARDNPKDPFTPDRRPLELKKLKVVAGVRGEDGRALRAAQADVPEWAGRSGVGGRKGGGAGWTPPRPGSRTRWPPPPWGRFPTCLGGHGRLETCPTPERPVQG